MQEIAFVQVMRKKTQKKHARWGRFRFGTVNMASILIFSSTF